MTEAAPPPVVTSNAVNPGKTLGIVGLILAFFFGLNIVGLILSIVGLKKSKRAGFSNGPALAGIIVSIVTIIIGAIILAVVIAGAIAVGGSIAEACASFAPGEVISDGNGLTITCP